MKASSAMRPPCVILASVAAAASLAAVLPTRAQDRPMPSHDYSSGAAQSYGLPEALPQPPAAAGQESDNAVHIPIPGGGEITVEGPAAPVRNPLPLLGGDTWSVHQTNSNSSGTGPIGP
jgi:hypothetical protein